MKPACAVIILAAGKGSRMNTSLPKVLHPVMGKPLLAYALDVAHSLQPIRVVTVLSPTLNNLSLPFSFDQRVVQDPPLGTGHAVQLALLSLSGLADSDVVFVLTGDVPALLPSSLQKVLDTFAENPLLQAVVLAMEAPLPHAYGRLWVDNEKLIGIIEDKEATPSQKQITLCNSGVLAFRVKALRQACDALTPSSCTHELYLTDAIHLIHKAGGKMTYITIEADQAQGVNTQTDLAVVENILQARARLAFLSKGVRMLAPSTVYFSYDTEIEEDVVIEPYVVFGKGVCIKKNSVIHSFSYLEECLVHKGTTIGPFARLRAGTEILEGAKIGNFVEVKNTVLGPYSKANHLAYLGDTTIGTQTNIGAGVITCNYDGYKKWSTEIGNNVFVGSNTALVAPLKIGNKALIAAGSTITKDVAPETLAVGRTKQIDIEQGAVKQRQRLELRAKSGKNLLSS